MIIYQFSLFVKKKIKAQKINVDFKGRSYKNLSRDKVKEMLDTIDCSMFAQNDVDACWNFLYNNMKSVLDTLCPEKNL